jgi:hypothetical protein
MGCYIHSWDLNEQVRGGKGGGSEGRGSEEGKQYHVALSLASHHCREAVGFLDCHKMAVEAAENADRADVLEIAAASAAVVIEEDAAAAAAAAAADAALVAVAADAVGADAVDADAAGSVAGAAGAGALAPVVDNVLRVAYCWEGKKQQSTGYELEIAGAGSEEEA